MISMFETLVEGVVGLAQASQVEELVHQHQTGEHAEDAADQAKQQDAAGDLVGLDLLWLRKPIGGHGHDGEQCDELPYHLDFAEGSGLGNPDNLLQDSEARQFVEGCPDNGADEISQQHQEDDGGVEAAEVSQVEEDRVEI